VTDKPAINAVLFDLDGTLLDTAADLAHALNNLRKVRQLPLIPLEKIRPEAGRGCQGLLKMGFDMDMSHPDYDSFSEELLNYYHSHLCDNTDLFTGMPEVLTYLEQHAIPWGIVTNKPQRFTQQLVEHIPALSKTNCIISGDSLTNRKPHPEPILHACALLKQKPQDCLYVGDSEIDIIASRAAGTPVLAALYGYIGVDENPQQWGADGYIEHPAEIISWILER